MEDSEDDGKDENKCRMVKTTKKPKKPKLKAPADQ
jgi:hypothetical protein